ncbi:MAG: hypothetical protein H7263_08590 [Candidatus Sericytochromatia bacterium]|nr:hypothetical protein [Candidatus Sericytochromatia bacterium]
MLGIFLFLISTSPDTYLFSFIGIVFCYIFHAYRMEIIKNPRFENFKLSIHIFTLIFPITVFVMSYLSSHFYSYLIYSLLQIMLYSWIAYTEKNDNLRKFLWWLTAILANIMEIFVLIRFDLLYGQIVFSFIGLSFILLSKIQKNIKDINQYLYLGQIFLLASPFLHEDFSFGIKLPLIEFFMTLGLFIFASFKIKRKAFLSLNVFLILTSISIGILLSFFNGNWIVRWGILLFLGSIITVIGTQIETKKEIFKKYINSASNFLKEWD